MTAEELAARVREDVDRNGDLIRKRDDARRGTDTAYCSTQPFPKQEEPAKRMKGVTQVATETPLMLVSTREKNERTCVDCGGDKGERLPICEPCEAAKYERFNSMRKLGHPEYRKLLNERWLLHLEKSGGYGTGTDPFANFTAVANQRKQPRFLYAVDRAQEKLTRVYSLAAQGRYDELGEEFTDLASLFDCAEAMRREDSRTDTP